MHISNGRGVLFASIALFASAILFLGSVAKADTTATISTDKNKYSVGEGMVITGSNFSADAPIEIDILRPDHVTEIVNVTSDDAGGFTTTYTPAVPLPGRFKITATDGTNSAKTATTEADAVGYQKAGYDKGTASWGTGNQSGYSENDWVQYQYTITGVTDTVPSLNVIFDEEVSGRMFIDGFSNFRYCIDCAYSSGTSANSVLPDGTPRPGPDSGTPGTAGGWHAFTPLNINYAHASGNGSASAKCSTTDSIDTPSAEHCFLIDPANPAWTPAMRNGFPPSFATSTHTITIFYEAHMAASFVWKTGHESQLRCQDPNNSVSSSIYCALAPTGAVPANTTYGTAVYAGWATTTFSGAGGGGSNKHFNIDNQSDGSNGGITLPIPAVTLPTGSVTITKVTNPTPAAGISFPFTSDFGPFTLDTDPSATYASSTSFTQLPAGTFNFTETQPITTGWNLTDISCVTSSGTAGSQFTTSTTTGLSTVNLASGAHATCTYTNTLQQGSIELKKAWVGTAGQTTLDIGTSAGGSQVDTQQTGAAGTAPLTTGANTVSPGTYYVSETGGLTGYDSSLACTDNGNTVTPGANNSVAVASNHTVVCTYTNTRQQGTIELKKAWVGTAGQTTLDIGTSAGGTQTASTLTGASGGAPLTTGTKTVDTGTYYVSETGGLTGYDSSLACTDNGSPVTPGANNALSVASGHSVICTYTNTRQQGSIELKKHWVGTASSVDLNIGTSQSGHEVDQAAGLTTDGTTGANTVDTGTYYVSEVVTNASNYDSSLSCVDAANNNAAVSVGGDGSVSVAKNAQVVCTYTNTRKQGTIELKKHWVGTAGNTTLTIGSSVGGSEIATQAANGADNTTGTKTVNTGAYYVNETDPGANYTSSLSCTDAQGAVSVGANNSVSVADGEAVVCTFTNTRKQGTIELKKHWVGGDGNTTLDIGTTQGGGDVATKAVTTDDTTGAKTVDTGTYYVSEDMTNLTHYESSLSCVDSANSNAAVAVGSDGSLSVGEGQAIVCTYTNTKHAIITIVKDAVPNDTQDFSFTDNFGGSNPASFSLDDDGNNADALPNTRDFEVLPNSGYSVSEDLPVAGWKQFSATCDNQNDPGSITVNPGDHVTCTFVNHKLATIVLVKHTIGGDDTFNYTMTGTTLPSSAQLITAGGWATTTFSNIDPDNTYSISEDTPPAGWVQNGVSCHNTSATGSVTSRTNTGFQPTNGGTVTCTFTNAKPDAYISIGETATNEVGNSHTFTITVTQVPNGLTPASSAAIAPSVSPTPGTLSDTCGTVSFSGNTATCTVTVNSTSAGVFTANASADVTIGGVALHRATGDSVSQDGGAATKTYVDGSIAITPASAYNEVGDPHTLTATVTQNDGTGSSAAAGVLVTFTIPSGSATFVAGDTCSTDGSGKCSVQITSAGAGSNTIHATATWSVGGVSITRATGDSLSGDSADASKTYEDAQILITGDAYNEVGQDHTFTVTVKQDVGDGSGLAAATGATVSPSISGTGSISGGTCESGTTDGSGQCTIVVHSTTPGTGTVHASVTLTLNGVSITRATSDGLSGDSADTHKTWVDGYLTLDPLTATNDITSPHTITAHVYQNSGAGYSDASGVVVNFTLVNNTAGASFVGDDHCTTDGSGTCTVQINSSSPGGVDIHGSATWTFDNVSLTRATGDSISEDSADAHKDYVAGGLHIEKSVVLGTYPVPANVTEDFTFTITGPSFPGAGTTGVIHVTGGVPSNTLDYPNIIPGSYTIVESDPGVAWSVSGNNADVTVGANATTSATVTNTIKEGHTTISITTNTQETLPGENVVVTITDTNDGPVPLTSPTVDFFDGTATTSLSKASTGPECSYTSGDTNNDGIMDPNEAWIWTCNVIISSNTTFLVEGHGNDSFGTDVSPENGVTSEAGQTTVTVVNTTRTLGFWQTHTTFTSEIFSQFFPSGMQVGVGPSCATAANCTATHKGAITNGSPSELFGGFYAPMAKTSTGAKRTQVDQARINLLQQLLAAELNCAAFGCSTATHNLITQANSDYAAGNRAAILADSGALDTYNNSMDGGAIPSNLPPTGRATPKTSQSIANIVFWNTP